MYFSHVTVCVSIVKPHLFEQVKLFLTNPLLVISSKCLNDDKTMEFAVYFILYMILISNSTNYIE